MNKKLGLLLAAVTLVAVAAVVTVIIVVDDETAGDPRAAPAPTTTTSLTPLDRACLDAGGEFWVRVYFDSEESDGHMRRAADALRDDDRITQLETETQSEAYERFKEIFKDQPELLEQARPEALPASIQVEPAKGVSNAELAGELDDELTGVDEIQELACVK